MHTVGELKRVSELDYGHDGGAWALKHTETPTLIPCFFRSQVYDIFSTTRLRFASSMGPFSFHIFGSLGHRGLRLNNLLTCCSLLLTCCCLFGIWALVHNAPLQVTTVGTQDVGLRLEEPTAELSAAQAGATDAGNMMRRQLPLKLRQVVWDRPLTGRTAITVVFSRPVIPIGSNYAGSAEDAATHANGLSPLHWQCVPDTHMSARPPVPGKLRWVTTYILRFDPDGDWPNDLNCTLRVNPRLEAFDGTPLDAAPAVLVLPLTTPALTMSIAAVKSKQAAAHTDGAWVSQSSGDPYHELPPDAVLDVSFNAPVDPAFVRGRLRIVPLEASSDAAATAVAVQPKPNCRSPPCSALVLRPGPLRVGALYNLTLPAGVKVSEYAGPLPGPVQQTVQGLHPFTFPWSTPGPMRSIDQMAHTNQRLWVRHGFPGSTGPLLQVSPCTCFQVALPLHLPP